MEKNKVRKLSPTDSLKSLEDYHYKVVALTNIVRLAIDKNLISDSISEMIKQNLEQVESFYGQ